MKEGGVILDHTGFPLSQRQLPIVTDQLLWTSPSAVLNTASVSLSSYRKIPTQISDPLLFYHAA